MQKGKRLQTRIIRSTIEVKSIIGFEYCVCFLTHETPPRLMISNIPRSSDLEETIVSQITQVCFPHLEFEVTERDFGSTLALVFTPI